MTTKEYLRSVRQMGLEIDIKRSRIARLKQIAEGTTIQLTGMPSGNGNPQRAQHCVEEAVTMEQEIQEQLLNVLKEQQKVMNTISHIRRPEYRLVLEMYYLLGWPWDKVAGKMCYSVQHTHRLHCNALAEFGKMRVNES